MRAKFPVLSLVVFLLCPLHSWAQNSDITTQTFGGNPQSFGIEDQFSYYVSEAD